MLIFDDFIYISNALASSHYIIKLDLDLHLINYLSVNVNFFSIAYDSCNNRLLGLWKSEDTNGIPVIGINIYNLNLRKLSEMNTTTINNNVKNLIGSSLELFFFMNKLYISAVDDASNRYIIVTDNDGHYITTYFLIKNSPIYPIKTISFDHFGNFLYTNIDQICLFKTALNKTTSCKEILDLNQNTHYFWLQPLYAKIDQSGRLVAINSLGKKIQFYY